MAFDLSVLDETVRRWRAFSQKIRDTADALHAQGLEEALRLRAEAKSDNDNASYLFWNGIGGQVNALRSKAQTTFEQQVEPAFHAKASRYNDTLRRNELHEAARDLFYQLRDERNALDEHLLAKACTNVSDMAANDDLEGRYLRIVQAFAASKDKFFCLNCGGQITIEKIFFIATYVSCPYCRTQNTFQPSDEARSLPGLAERIADQRAEPMRLEWVKAAQQVPIWKAETAALWRQKLQCEVDAHTAYIHAKFDVIDSIVPDLKPQNDLVRQARISDRRKSLPADAT
jgi:hypothetical protein